MNKMQPRPTLALALGASLTTFLTAGILALLLLRLGDTAGARRAGWLTLAAAAAMVVTTALLALVTQRDSAR
jgi:hypothetical protein